MATAKPSTMPTPRYLSYRIPSTTVCLASGKFATPLLVRTISLKYSLAPCPFSLRTQRRSRFWLSSVAHGTAVEAMETEGFGETNGDEEVNRRKLYVTNLPWDYSASDLQKLFGQFGHVHDVEIIKQRNGKSRGFAFVAMSSPEEAHVAVEKLDSFELSGRIIRVELAKNFKKPYSTIAPTITNSPNGETRNWIYVSNLAWKVRSSNLREFFADKFKPVSARVVFNGPSGRSAGYGFVSFATNEEVVAAISELDGKAWFPDDNSRDCSHGFCTIYCPQWCYALFPPPPPFPLTGNFNHRAAAFSPPVITIIGILATFFLLTTYYKLVSKFCAFLYSRRSPPHHRSNPNDSVDDEEETDSADSYHQESWHLPPSNGLDEAFIRKITTFRYKRGEGLVEGTECSVCLSEFIEDENLRLLPKCSHAFHLQCIDTWLKSHSNCPLCRVNILLPTLASEEDEQDAVVIAVRDLDLVKDFEAIEMAEDRRRPVPAGFSRRGRGERGKVRSGRSRGLLSVMSPVRMKRSVSSGRNGFARQGRRRRRALLLPVCVMAA